MIWDAQRQQQTKNKAGSSKERDPTSLDFDVYKDEEHRQRRILNTRIAEHNLHEKSNKN